MEVKGDKYMLANMQAIYIGQRTGSFKSDDNKEINYTSIALGNPDPNKSDQVMNCSVASDVDINKLVRFTEYNFIIEVPVILKDKQKIKIVGVVPFKVEDNKSK